MFEVFFFFTLRNCDKMTNRRNVEKGLFVCALRRNPQFRKAGRHGPGSSRQLTTQHCPTERESWFLVSFLPFFFFIQSGSEAYSMVLPTLRYVFPPQMNRRSQRCVPQAILNPVNNKDEALFQILKCTPLLFTVLFSSSDYGVCNFSITHWLSI